jgi:pimeloyl-ACP methyl ester carboxylesterase
VDAVGIEVPGHPVADFFSLTLDQVFQLSYCNLELPALVVWGECDRIADPDYGRAFAAAIPGARFQLLTGAGHTPQLETPGQLLDAVWA